MQTRLFATLSPYWRRIDKKPLGLVAALFALILFGDSLPPLLGHVLHMLVEAVEWALEHFLEAVFGLSPRQAQVILFYSGLAITLYLSWRLSRKAYFTALYAYSTAMARWRAIAGSAKAVVWFRIMVMVGALSASLYLFI